MVGNEILNELIEITNSLDATTEKLICLQENAKYEDAIKKIDIDLYLELPIQELSKLANRLAQISYELSILQTSNCLSFALYIKFEVKHGYII